MIARNLIRNILSIIAPGAQLMDEPYEHLKGIYAGQRSVNGMQFDMVLIPVVIKSRALKVIGHRIPKRFNFVSAMIDENGVLRIRVEDIEQFVFEASPSEAQMYINEALTKQP